MTSSAVRTAARVASEIPGFPFRTRLTVASLTPACLATSASLPTTLQDYCKILQHSRDVAIPTVKARQVHTRVTHEIASFDVEPRVGKVCRATFCSHECGD